LGEGGASVLVALIDRYFLITKRFLAPATVHPCIVLLDNDTGAKAVEGALKKHKISWPSGRIAIHVHKNLYAMRTPALPGKPSTAIEDFFDAAVKATKLDGKSFHSGKGFDPSIHYGKKIFAHKVIRANAATINFSAFAGVLTPIVAIQAHALALSTAGGPPPPPLP
jgi:hypothetical protein